MGWTIKEMSEKSGISTDTLRYYDKLGILSPKRNTNGYRYYEETDLMLIQYITIMKYAEFSLSEIKEVVRMIGLEPSDECNKLNKDILKVKKLELLEKMKNYKKIVKIIDIVLLMIEDKETFIKNEEKLISYIHELYDKTK